MHCFLGKKGGDEGKTAFFEDFLKKLSVTTKYCFTFAADLIFIVLTMDICLYIKLEPYLRQWLVHEHNGTEPVEFIRNSQEREIIKLFLSTPPKDYRPPKKTDDLTPILIPFFKGRDPQYYNYLSDDAVTALRSCIYTRFKITLWADLYVFENFGQEIMGLLEAWMHKNGIVNDDTNYQAVKQIFYRMRKAYRQRKLRNSSKM